MAGELVLFVLPTPINLSFLNLWLASYGNTVDGPVLFKGFSKGFSLEYTGPRVARDSDCLASAAAQPQLVQEKLAAEIATGRVAGPFVKRPFKHLQCSPIGLVPKHGPNKFRLIHQRYCHNWPTTN